MQKRTIAFLTGVAMVLVPLHVSAATWSIETADEIAGFGAEIRVVGDPMEDIEVTIQRPHERDLTLSKTTDERGEAVITLQPRETERAGEYNVIVRDMDGKKLAATMIEVFPDVPALLMLDPDDDVLMEGETTTIMVSIFDRFDNPLPNRPVILVSSDGEVKKFDDETNSEGAAEFSFTPDTSGEVDIVAVDVLSDKSERFTLDVEPAAKPKSKNALSASLLDEYEQEKESTSTKSFGFIDHFDIEIDNLEPVLRINVPYNFSLTARDRNNKRVNDYVGSVIVESTDPLAEVPQSAVKFRASDRGRIDLPLALMFGTPGEHKIFAKDTDDEDIRGFKESVWVVGHNATLNSGRILVESHKGSVTVPTRRVTISGKAPVYIGLDLYDNEKLLTSGSSDENGRFTFSVALDASQTVHAMIVRESDGGLDRVSEIFTLTVDDSPPEITDFVLMPAAVEAGQPFTARVTADPDESVMVKIGNGVSVVVPETSQNPDGTSTYEVSLLAPEESREHIITIMIRDSAGNEIQSVKTLTVKSHGVATVQNIKASSDGDDIVLSWPAVPGAVQYRIYWGTSPLDLSRQIDTGSAATSARLTGLQTGVTYHFAMTAIDGKGAESPMSQTVSVATKGSLFALQALPRINGAHLQWTAIPGSNVNGYVVQYGVQSGVYSEQRQAGALQTQLDLTDLINGVTYYLKLSATQSNGQMLTDRVEVTVVAGENGQPGLYLSPSEPLPGSVGGPPEHNAPSSTTLIMPVTGLPLFAWVSALLVGITGYTGLRMYRQRLQEKKIIAVLTHQFHKYL